MSDTVPGANITISAEDVKDFKVTYCDENGLIMDLLKKECVPFFEEPIMAVGGGTADILSRVLAEKKVIHLDVLDFSDVKIPAAHTRVTGDFLNSNVLRGLRPITTLFMSHVQQFIDGDIAKLKAAIEQADAKRVILVEDVNDDFLGEVARYCLANIPNANPEVAIEDFPYGYKRVATFPFMATLSCPTFPELTRQCLYLMDLEQSEENKATMSAFLKMHLTSPMFTINQEINVYER